MVVMNPTAVIGPYFHRHTPTTFLFDKVLKCYKKGALCNKTNKTTTNANNNDNRNSINKSNDNNTNDNANTEGRPE